MVEAGSCVGGLRGCSFLGGLGQGGSVPVRGLLQRGNAAGFAAVGAGQNRGGQVRHVPGARVWGALQAPKRYFFVFGLLLLLVSRQGTHR